MSKALHPEHPIPEPAKPLPAAITSYDLIKFFAVVIMIVDHMGWYFFPDDLWWRAIGRIGFPVWFFLIGYSRGRDIPNKLLGGACLLLVANLIVGMPLFPLNALFTIMIIRVFMDKMANYALKSYSSLVEFSLLATILILPSYILTEYGTLALITALFGYTIRHRQEINDDKLVISYMIFALSIFILFQQLIFNFTAAQFIFMALGTMVVRICLLYFKPHSFNALTQKLPSMATFIVQLSGRRTLEIYVIHLLAFKFIALYMGLNDTALFDLKLLNLDFDATQEANE